MPRPTPTACETDRRPRIARRAGRLTAMIALAILTDACARPQPADEPAAVPQQPAGRPLAPLATQAVALFPAQYLRMGDSTVGAPRLGAAPAVLASLDSAIAAELAFRGTARAWVMADALTRTARRNPAFTSDPHALSAESLRHGVRRTNPRLGEPLASQMRSLVALTEARFGLIPAELRFEAGSTGGTRAILRLVLIDARLAQIQWSDDVFTDVTSSSSTSEIVSALAKRVADLLVVP